MSKAQLIEAMLAKAEEQIDEKVCYSNDFCGATSN